MNTALTNEPLLELRRASVRARLEDALAEVDSELPLRVPVLTGGDRRFGDELVSIDPSAPTRTVAVAPRATSAEVDAGVRYAASAAGEWAERPARERAGLLIRAAGVLRDRRPYLAALAVRECAKPWKEADADVCEAIDFLEYYARQAVALDAEVPLRQVPGESNAMRYVGRGVVAVIAPWNFPLAILAGMTAASLASGNSAVVKPAEQSPACGWEVVRAMHEAGIPREALSFLPGAGSVGATLVSHPQVHTIAFTGSVTVGLEIMAKAATIAPGQRHIKRVIAELGGKNCVLVDSDADLDQVVPAVAYSAFGFAGQKCSAAGRVLVHEDIAGVLFERLAGTLETLSVDSAAVFGVDVPPVIEHASQERLEGYVGRAADASAAVRRGAPGPGGGWFVAPTLVLAPHRTSPIVRDELFGPVVTVEPVHDLDEACEIVDHQPVALTGGLFSRNPRVVQEVARRLRVGNLYINRHITGAMVGRQPFGGNRLSGTGAKAGGPGYLHQFVDPVVVTENTMRHGLVV